ncbi:MAG: hypothetical protein H0W76_28010 [Pyrinomonadaceae bacterium]|nr:hypothetical protein [Pyrinomonadaceae bacterium]
MSKRGQRAKEIQETIRQVLLHQWDPIGVSDIPEAQDEYDSYVGGIYRLLASGASEHQIIERLYNIETVSMGLPSNRAGLKNVAEKLAKLAVSL